MKTIASSASLLMVIACGSNVNVLSDAGTSTTSGGTAGGDATGGVGTTGGAGMGGSTSATGGTTTNSQACQDLQQTAQTAFDSFVAAHQNCTTDADCTTAGNISPCVGPCLNLMNSASTVTAADYSAQLCSDFFAQGCSPYQLMCITGPATCNSGTCAYSWGAGGSSGVGGSTGAAGAGGTTGTGGTSATTTSPSGALGPWALTADYPLASNNCVGSSLSLYCSQQTCVASSGYVYCLGGDSTLTYYSQLSSAGLGPWIPTADYPVPVERASCVVSSNYIYCVGGTVGSADGGTISPTANVYYAPLLSPGIGEWTASTPFPEDTAQCMTDSGYIYCVTRSSPPDAYYAPLSSSGVGTWTPTAGPPTITQGCTSAGGYVYCFGGGGCAPTGPASDCYSPSYFAPLTASGIGTWKTTTDLPTAVSATYATAGSYIYYLSIPVFFAPVSADGIGPWQTTTNYPDSTYPANCVSSEASLYCASPLTNSSYFAQIGAPNPQALQLENPPPFPRSEYMCPAWNSRGSCRVTANGVTVGALCPGKNIDEAFVFNCASQAATSAGCTTTVLSSNTAYNFDVTVWYPCPNQTTSDTNCCFLPAVGYGSTPFNAWCSSIGSDSFIIAEPITMNQSQ